MKLVHISDTHLGFSAYRALDKEWGVNQREADVARAFSQAVDRILDIEPDIFVHTGDLFDSVRPSNRSLSFALEQILRLAKTSIPCVLIAGNHSTPKIQDAGSIFRLFELFDNVYPVYNGAYESHLFKNTRVHAVPHCPTKEVFLDQVKRVSTAGDFSADHNLFFLHAGVDGIREFSMGDFNEQAIPFEALKPAENGNKAPGFDYIGLGHYHAFAKVADNTYYSGSTERLSFNEAGSEKGFIEVALGATAPRVTFRPLVIRPMVDLETIDAKDAEAERLSRVIKDTIAAEGPQGKILRLRLTNLSSATRDLIDFKEIQAAAAGAVHFEITYTDDQEQKPPGLRAEETIGSLSQEFATFIAGRGLGKNAAAIKELGLAYLEQTEE